MVGGTAFGDGVHPFGEPAGHPAWSTPLRQAAVVAPAATARIALNALPHLLRTPKPPQSTADLVALASRLVTPGSPVPPDVANEVATVAGRGGSTRLVTEARRLHRVLAAAPYASVDGTTPAPAD